MTSGRTPVLVVGAGRVGRALGANLMCHGYSVTFAVRRPASDLPLGASTTELDGAGAIAGFVILAVPFDAVVGALERLALRPGTVLVDATNPFGRSLPDGATSGAQLVQQAAGHGVHVVKAFNVLGAEHMEDPVLPDGARPVLPVAGDDPAARATVAALAGELGFDAVDVGGLAAAHVLEEAARYWGPLAMAGGRGRGIVLVAHER